jgi:hypothetical protein
MSVNDSDEESIGAKVEIMMNNEHNQQQTIVPGKKT